MLLFITSCHIDIWTYTWTHTYAHRQVDILAECVETKHADAQTDSSVLTRISGLALIMM